MKNLLFSSVGDESNFPDFWLNDYKNKNFDLFICYYGNYKDNEAVEK